jgi:hypothetical protein
MKANTEEPIEPERLRKSTKSGIRLEATVIKITKMVLSVYSFTFLISLQSDYLWKKLCSSIISKAQRI